MKNKAFDNVKLGLFVMAGALFLVLSLYMIGKNRNLFHSTFTISTQFHTVSGLMPGNNVRYAGIDVGTVKRVKISSDSTVEVIMIIDKSVKGFIKDNVVASVGTDGLMGNKLVNINSVPGGSLPLEEGSVIASIGPVETDEMLRTLNTTNDNIAAITNDLKKITQKINNSNSLWSLLSDTSIALDVKQAAAKLNMAADHTATAVAEVAELTRQVRNGKGLAGTLLTDTVLVSRLNQAMLDVQRTTQGTAAITNDLKGIMNRVKAGEGTAGKLLTDSTMIQGLQQGIINIEEGTRRFNENMEALKHNFLFRGYFKRQEKKKKKSSGEF